MPMYAKLAAIFTLIHRLLELGAPDLDKRIHQLVDDVLDILGDFRNEFAHLNGGKTESVLTDKQIKEMQKTPEQSSLDL